MFDEEVTAEAGSVLEAARAAGAQLVTAESCTGGLVVAALTAIAGSSDVVFGGYATYANEAKVALGVPEALLAQKGAVSAEVARALAVAARDGALAAGAPAPVAAVSVTGVAGPGGGSVEKPIGLVHFGASVETGTLHREIRLGDLGRDEVRRRSILAALSLLREALAR